MTIADYDFSRPSPFGTPLASAVLRQSPEDFRVTEIASVTPSGSGEHAWLRIRKRGENTDWVARELARLAGCKPRDVSYAGLKDRWAVTEQWFSVHLPGQADPDWNQLNSDTIRVLEATRHDRKLRRGTLQGNRFEIVLREVNAPIEVFQQRFTALTETGWPNYFGDQRFGRENSNLALFEDLVSGRARKPPRHKRSLAISAARSLLFNRILARRVELGNWNQWLPGEVFQLDGRSALFASETGDENLDSRLAGFEIHPTGPLWGRGQNLASGECLALETEVLADYAAMTAGLEKLGAQLDRRALRVRPQEMDLAFVGDDTIRLSFVLPAGRYATVLIEQLVDISASGLE